MNDLIEFLRARLDEVEWLTQSSKDVALKRTHYRKSMVERADRDLRDVAFKRAVIGDHEHVRFAELPSEWPQHWRDEARPAFPGDPEPFVGCKRCAWNTRYEVVDPDWWCDTVRRLAEIYRDHPDWREDWRP